MLKEKDAPTLLQDPSGSVPLSAHQQIVHPLSLPALYGPTSRLLVELSRHPDLSPRLISLRWRPLDLLLPAEHSSTPPSLRRRSGRPLHPPRYPPTQLENRGPGRNYRGATLRLYAARPPGSRRSPTYPRAVPVRRGSRGGGRAEGVLTVHAQMKLSRSRAGTPSSPRNCLRSPFKNSEDPGARLSARSAPLPLLARPSVLVQLSFRPVLSGP